MDFVTITGCIAGTLTTASFLPQVLRSWKLRETRDLSLAMLVMFAIGVFLWTIYGVWVNSLPVIAANAVTLVLIAVLLYLKAVYH